MRSRITGEAVVMVPATTVAKLASACALRQQWVAALGPSQEFPGSRQGFPGWRSVAYRSGAPSGLDWRRAGPRFVPARRDPPPSDAAAPGRWREWQAISRARFAQLLPLASPTRTAEQQ